MLEKPQSFAAETTREVDTDSWYEESLWNERELTGEQRFHQERFRRAAERYNRKWHNRLLGRKKVPVDFAYEEAGRDDEEYERRLTAEYQKWFAHFEAVRDELLYVRDNPEAAEREGKRPMLFIMGGAMRGVYAAGQVMALHEAGLGDVFKAIGGSSAGSGPAAFFAAGPEQAKRSARLFHEDCTTREFLDIRRFPRILDTSVIERRMRDGEKSLDIEALRNSSAEVFALATNQGTQAVDIVDMKTATHDGELDPIKLCVASANIPLFSPRPIEVNGNHYHDGSINELPLEEIIEKYKPTSILFLPNMAFHELDEMENSSLENIVGAVAGSLGSSGSLGSVAPMRPVPEGNKGVFDNLSQVIKISESSRNDMSTLEKIVTSREATRHALEEVGDAMGVKIGVAFPPASGLTNLSNNPDVFKNAILGAARSLLRDLGVSAPEVMSF